MSRWYRAYEGTCTDAKLGEVALIAECSRSVAIAAWHCLLENCAGLNEGGKFDLTARRLAVILGEPVTKMADVFNAFEELAMTQGGVVTAWATRQFESDKDPTAPARMRRYRARKANEDGNVTPVTRNGDGSYAPHSTETDTEKKEPTSNEVGPAEPVETPQQRLWSQGVPWLIGLGVPNKEARSVIGKWLKQSDDDHARVLVAIQTARDREIVEPVAWITAGFAKIKSRRETVHERQSAIAQAFGPTLYDIAEQRHAGVDEPDRGLRLALPSPA